jgi:hypothetical protein
VITKKGRLSHEPHLFKNMGRPRKSNTIHSDFRGVTISFYPTVRGTWEASFTVPGTKRKRATGISEANCRENAHQKIRDLMGLEGYAARTDEEAARRLLEPYGVSHTEAARCWLAQNAKPVLPATVGQLRGIWLAHRSAKRNTRRYHHVRALRTRSEHLLPAFGERQISSITVTDLNKWQNDIEECVSPRTARNIHDAAKDLWKFGRKLGYLDPERISAMEQIDRPKGGSGSREVYSPEEWQKLVNAGWALASPAAVPMVVAGRGFLRTEELCRRDPDEPLENRASWEDINWEENFIYVRKEVSKTKEGRRAGLPKTLKAMLRPRRGSGPIFTLPRLDVEYQKIAKFAGVKLKFNAFRHSCLTYAMLLAHNATEVANKAGNSVAIIERNYRNRNATLKEARRWAAIVPQVAWGSAVKTGK